MSIKMKELPISERPYEKLEMYGATMLSNAELLAIIIKNGTKEESSVTLAQKILSLPKEKNCKQNSLEFLQELSIEEFMQIHGIGKVKAIQIKAVCELAKRISKPMDIAKITIKYPEDVAKIVMDELKAEKKEIVKVIILNSQNNIIKIQTISVGGTNAAYIEPKNIFVEAIKSQATKIILVHNHPGGSSIPSQKDCEVTKKMEEAAKLLSIELLDHIVIGNGEFTSIKAYNAMKEQVHQSENKIATYTK